MVCIDHSEMVAMEIHKIGLYVCSPSIDMAKEYVLSKSKNNSYKNVFNGKWQISFQVSNPTQQSFTEFKPLET